MSTFDDFMIAETSQKNQEIRRLQEELSSLRSEVDTLKGIVKELQKDV
jgi:prefoldin subunit 5